MDETIHIQSFKQPSKKVRADLVLLTSFQHSSRSEMCWKLFRFSSLALTFLLGCLKDWSSWGPLPLMPLQYKHYCKIDICGSCLLRVPVKKMSKLLTVCTEKLLVSKKDLNIAFSAICQCLVRTRYMRVHARTCVPYLYSLVFVGMMKARRKKSEFVKLLQKMVSLTVPLYQPNDTVEAYFRCNIL